MSFQSSFWSTTLSFASKIYSIGSSIVRICFFSVWLISSTIAASVVDFPDPVAPAKKIIPFVLCESSLKIPGKHSDSRVGTFFLKSLATIIMCPLCLEIFTLYLLSWYPIPRSILPCFSKKSSPVVFIRVNASWLRSSSSNGSRSVSLWTSSKILKTGGSP